MTVLLLDRSRTKSFSIYIYYNKTLCENDDKRHKRSRLSVSMTHAQVPHQSLYSIWSYTIHIYIYHMYDVFPNKHQTIYIIHILQIPILSVFIWPRKTETSTRSQKRRQPVERIVNPNHDNNSITGDPSLCACIPAEVNEQEKFSSVQRICVPRPVDGQINKSQR